MAFSDVEAQKIAQQFALWVKEFVALSNGNRITDEELKQIDGLVQDGTLTNPLDGPTMNHWMEVLVAEGILDSGV